MSVLRQGNAQRQKWKGGEWRNKQKHPELQFTLIRTQVSQVGSPVVTATRSEKFRKCRCECMYNLQQMLLKITSLEEERKNYTQLSVLSKKYKIAVRAKEVTISKQQRYRCYSFQKLDKMRSEKEYSQEYIYAVNYQVGQR